ncbi:Lactate utilization protein C [Rubripirellula amarantea]|uniref:Lactate utilization protein C n=2 Tax=Rubripirellula amarantea TaxID=2527999 RepID=A0A5C5WG45_9BACT|nr:Lactate utilization protein C [Rubripirellula amarantea]
MIPHTHSKQAVMDRLRGHDVKGPELPIVDSSRLTTYDNPMDTFIESLQSVGGQAHVIDRIEQVHQILSEIPVFADAERIASLAPDYVPGNVDASLVTDPHHLESLDWVIATGEFGVAENGSIWVDGKTLPHRVMLFIAQYSAIIVPKAKILHNMHEGYAALGTPEPGFGIFISGPSKTADIEQSLVLGAHGCRKLQVFLV